MGSGASSLTNEQKAQIAKDMKEKYESLDPSQQATAQEDMMKHYEELVKKVQAEIKSEAQPVGLPKGKRKFKKIVRNRSFDNGNFLMMNTVNKMQPTEPKPDEDFWDSVTTQPVCLVCKMVFNSETKRDTHVKYSEVHAKNVQAMEAKEKQSQEKAEEKKVAPEVPSFRCREIYTGSKFYWRLQDTIEFNMYLHLEQNVIEIIPYDHHAQKEYDRLYFDENKLYSAVGAEKVTQAVKEIMETHEKDKTPQDIRPKEEDVLADQRRQGEVSLLMSKLQLRVVDEETKTKAIICDLNIDGDANPAFPGAPQGVTPVLVKRRRLSTTEEIEAALQSASALELKVNVKLHEAEELESLAHVEK